MLDDAPSEVNVPGDLAAALAAVDGARARFDALNYTARDEAVRGVEEVNAAVTRERPHRGVVDGLGG